MDACSHHTWWGQFGRVQIAALSCPSAGGGAREKRARGMSTAGARNERRGAQSAGEGVAVAGRVRVRPSVRPQGCAHLSIPRGAAIRPSPGVRPSDHPQGCAHLPIPRGAPARPTDRVGMKGAGSLGPSRTTQAPQRSEERSEARRVERAGGFQGVAVGFCVVRERTGGFQGVAVGFCVVRERAGGFQGVAVGFCVVRERAGGFQALVLVAESYCRRFSRRTLRIGTVK